VSLKRTQETYKDFRKNNYSNLENRTKKRQITEKPVSGGFQKPLSYLFYGYITKKNSKNDLRQHNNKAFIEILSNGIYKVTNKNKFLEIGVGSGRTAKTILSINDKAKYVIADLPPAINVSLRNLKVSFPDKKIAKAFEINDQQDLNSAFEKNDVLFVFPHQIKLFQKKTFDLSIAINCLHEMDKKTIKNYMLNFEKISKSIYIKVWETAGLPYSFFQYYSVHKKEDYFINDHWKEHFKERCTYPSKFFELGYEF